MRLSVVLLSIFVTLATATDGEFRGWPVYRLKADDSQTAFLGQLVSDVDGFVIEQQNERPKMVAVAKQHVQDFEYALNNKGIEFKVESKDLDRDLQTEEDDNNMASWEAELAAAKISTSADRSIPVSDVTTKFAKSSEIRAWLESVAQSSGGFCTTQSIGKSYQNKDLKILKCGSGNKPIVWLDSAIHAREHLAPATLLYIIKKLVNGRNSGSAKAIFDKYDFQFHPVVNPDGYDYTFTNSRTRFWRKTRQPYGRYYGADPNRNFDSNFGGPSTSRNPSSDIYCGPRPFSEPESRYMAQHIQSIASKVKLYISFHTYGQLWLTPPGFTRVNPSDHAEVMRVANAGARALKAVNGNSWRVGQPANVGLYEAAGGSYDYVREKLGVKYSYTLELRPRWPAGMNGFLAYVRDIQPSGEEVYAAILASANAVP